MNEDNKNNKREQTTHIYAHNRYMSRSVWLVPNPGDIQKI